MPAIVILKIFTESLVSGFSPAKLKSKHQCLLTLHFFFKKRENINEKNHI